MSGHRDTRPRCTACGHVHTGPELGGICLDCQCEHLGGAQQCQKCAGCGRIANDDEGTPWTFWENLPLKSAAAVLVGLVRPIPCPECGGSGSVTR